MSTATVHVIELDSGCILEVTCDVCRVPLDRDAPTGAISSEWLTQAIARHDPNCLGMPFWEVPR